MIRLRGKRPTNLGVHNGRLAACPPTPNCVCSQTDSESHFIAPLSYEGDSASAMQRLRSHLGNMRGVRVIEADARYLYAEFESRIFGFVDDVEFFVDEAAEVIHVRSASRLGYSDLGANRKRVEQLRADLGRLVS